MRSIHFISLHNSFVLPNDKNSLLLRLAQTGKTMRNILFPALKQIAGFKSDMKIKFIYGDNLSVKNINTTIKNVWVIISNGRFITKINPEIIEKLVTDNDKDVIMINVEEKLKSFRENARIKPDNEVVGYRRFFSDSVIQDVLPQNWPHHTLIRLSVIKEILNDFLPMQFDSFLNLCTSNSLTLYAVKIGGRLLDLETEQGLLSLTEEYISLNHTRYYKNSLTSPGKRITLYNNVILGKNVHIDDNVSIIGPAIIADNVIIHSSAVIYRSIICPGTSIPRESLIHKKIAGLTGTHTSEQIFSSNFHNIDNFRKWPLFSYARLGKRLCDIIVLLIILPVFAVIFVIVAAVIKFTDPGSIFFKHKRQGLYGKSFSCLKFRTMIANADEIQGKLKFKNQVDGPQFKIDDDPRVISAGRFLRETHLDEIPQFINILLGQMSFIGPRPSPARENCYCSHWRDARLSVRPGITGAWQIYKTREPGCDFQEWIYHDTEYVKNMSFKQDVKIFFGTIMKLLSNFIKQF